MQRADWLVGSHSLKRGDLTWPMTAAEGVAFAKAGISAWRDGLAVMTDEDLDTVGRGAPIPTASIPELPLIEIVWWVSKELLFHAGEIWFMRATCTPITTDGNPPNLVGTIPAVLA